MFVFFDFPLKYNLLQSCMVMKALCLGELLRGEQTQLSRMCLHRSLGARASRAEDGTVIFLFFPNKRLKNKCYF